MGQLLTEKKTKIAIYDKRRVNGGSNYDSPGPRRVPKLVIYEGFIFFSIRITILVFYPYPFLSLCHNLRFSYPISLYQILQNSQFEISKVYDIGLQRFRDQKIRICDKDSILYRGSIYIKDFFSQDFVKLRNCTFNVVYHFGIEISQKCCNALGLERYGNSSPNHISPTTFHPILGEITFHPILSEITFHAITFHPIHVSPKLRFTQLPFRPNYIYLRVSLNFFPSNIHCR